MNILMLCNKSPYPAGEGGPMAMNSIVKGLIGAGHNVKILAVNSEKYHIKEEDIPKSYKKETNIELVDVDLSIKPIAAFKNLFTDKSYHVERFISDNFKNKLIEILEKNKYDIVQLEMIYMAPYIETIREHSDATIVLRAHNVEHLIWERIAKKTKFPLKRWYINHLVRTLRKYEMNVINKVDGIAAITYRDAAFFRGETAVPVIDIPFGVNPDEFNPAYEVKDNPTLYHIGSMNWMPNEEGIHWFLDNVWDKVAKRNPDLQLNLAGRNMPKWLLKLKKKNVNIVGEVPDAKEFVKNNDIAVVPLLSGSGIRIKIIESMAMGKTVVTTMVGAEGIQYSEYENIIIADSPSKMVEVICKIVKEPDEAQRIGCNARRLVEDIYDNKKIIERLLLFYDEISSAKKNVTHIN
ncbi:MAG: glycosyltransferase [Lentimicrobiaceae bacterium]|nr:glycosyltransferase [Lentimicrobiaceae bacterium]